MMPVHDKDPLGHAVSDYLQYGKAGVLNVLSDIAEDDTIPVEYLFRSVKEMPDIEKTALSYCKGNVLDVGAGAGSHSLHLQNAGINVDALEISELCCTVMKERGVKQIINQDFFSYGGRQYDVILMLMNGIGLAGDLKGLEDFFHQILTLLAPGGYVLFDSSDLSYLYEEEDEPVWKDLNKSYYGELQYQMCYEKICGDEFKWLFIDPETMNFIAAQYSFEVILLAEGKHYDYLGMLRKKS